MDVVVWIISYLFIAFRIWVVQSYPLGLNDTTNSTACDECKPGYYVFENCSRRQNTVCAPCPDGQFTTDWNLNSSCTSCSECSTGYFQVKSCTRTEDSVCDPCSHKPAANNSHYFEKCSKKEPVLADTLPDYSPASESSHNQTADFHGDNENINSFNKTDELLALFDNKTAENVTAGYNETILYGSDLDLAEGSGYVFEEKEDEMDLSMVLQNNISINPSDAVKDGLLPVYANSQNIPQLLDDGDNTTRTIDTEQGSGLVLKAGLKNDSKSKTRDDESHQEKSLDYSGDGILLHEDKTDLSTTFIVRANSTERAVLIGKAKERDESTDVTIPDEVMYIEASRDEQEDVHNSGDDARRRTAIIVGVAVGGACFFAIGFVMSRCCKRHKVFKVMKKVPESDKNINENGNVECLEFNDLRPGTCIYNDPDEVGSVKVKLVSSDDDSLVKSKDYTSNKKKPSTGNVSNGRDAFVQGLDKLKFMDETTDEELEVATARDRLLADSRSEIPDTTENNDNRENAKVSTNTLADGVMNKLNQKLAPIQDERSPMLPKQKSEDDEQTS